MKNILKILTFWPILIQTTFAAQTLAVLEIIPATDDIEITLTEYRHLTDELRRQAVRTLPSTDYAVLTRDNMISLLPPDEEAAQCLAESCAVDIGRAIGAEFISQGRIGIFGGELSLSIELYETMGGKHELRRQAVRTLPSTDYAVLTRDNMISLLPPDEEAAQCLAESCAVDIGRAIGAEFISQGRIGIFGGELSLSIELYETMRGKLLSSIVIESKDVRGLMAAIREQAPELFAKIKQGSEPRFSGLKDSRDKELKPNATKKSNTSFYIALGLDILGAAALGFGIYQHANFSKLHDDYKKMPWQPSEQHGQYEDARKKTNDAKNLRNIGLAVGSGLLASGIAVHIWF